MNNSTLKKFLTLHVNPDETWQGGIVPMPDVLGVPAAENLDEMAMVLWRSTSSELVHAQPLVLSDVDLFNGFVEIMIEFFTVNEFPFRPAQIECNDEELADRLNTLMTGSGTSVLFVAEMSDWNALAQDMSEHFNSASPMIPSLRDVGCSEHQIREFADAAAAFYRAGLWDYLDDVDLVKIETPKPPRYLKNVVILGAASKAYGLGFFEDPEDHYDLMSQQVDPRELNLVSLTFDSPVDVVVPDVELWRELDLPLETGEALPLLNCFVEEGSRRPTPNELDFVSIVLKALAATREVDIDSGRWTKSVNSGGKQKKCVLSIPNLLDPPDRGEWMRRGMRPERRSNERHFKLVEEFIQNSADDMNLDELNAAISAKFTGPMDDVEYPMDTPANRAEASCQQAIDSFGRRRIQLAKQALCEDPTHVEANILLAESTRPIGRRIELFQTAIDNGKTQLGAMMEEEVGHFWGVTETRPFMRASFGLAEALHEAGQTNEAIELYKEMLRLNPNDNQGVRYEMIPLLLAHNREPEAIGLLEDYREETAFWHYMNALVEFRLSGRSSSAKQALRSAFRANKHVVALMQSTEPPLHPDSYAFGSPEEAAICVSELTAAWDETEGYVEWMFRESALLEQEKARRLRERRRKQLKKKSQKRRRR